MVERTLPLTSEPLRTPEEQLGLMALHLRADRERLLIATTPDAEADQALAEQMRLRLADEVAVETVTFSSESVAQLSLSQLLGALPPPAGKAVAFVVGLDDLPRADRDTAINALNWGRERLRWVGYSIVLWVRPQTPGELGNRAPDFFSWRSDVLEFDLPAHPAERQLLLTRSRLFTQASLDDLRQRYLDYLIQTYQWLDFRGLLQLRNVVRLPLDDVFVPLHATTATDTSLPFAPLPTAETDRVFEWQTYASRRVEHRIAFHDAMRQHQYLVLLGDPGSGKSTLLRFLALTFAQGQDQVQDQLGLSEARMPILISLSAFAEAQQRQPALSLTAFLPSYFTEQGLPDFSPMFDAALRSGQALVLLDGLNEMLTHRDRAKASYAVTEFAHLYPTTRIVVTSRIAGYAPGVLPASFATLTLAPFDDEAIRQFASQWSLAFAAMGLSSASELSPDARHRATRRAENLAHAALSHEGVRRLATNPLLLTLLALIHYQGTRLPHRRADLYRLCVEALAETWNLARSLTGRPIDLRLGERRLDEAFVVGILAPIAHWLHETQPTGAVAREALETRIAELFIENEGVTQDEAADLARDFVDLAREQLGLLVERAPDVFSFLHLSVQEYLVARFLSERQDGFERLKPRLHHPRWREVVLLTAGCLRGDFAAAFVEKLLDAHGSFDTFLPRALALRQPLIPNSLEQDQQTELDIETAMMSILDVLLATNCIGDGVVLPLALRQRICHVLFELWTHPPFYALDNDLDLAFTYMSGSVIGKDVRDFLIRLLQAKNQDDIMPNATATATIQARRATAGLLGRGWTGDSEVRTTLLDLLQNRDENSIVRHNIAMVLGVGWAGDSDIRSTILFLLQNANEDFYVRSGSAIALGRGWDDDLEIETHLLFFLKNLNENKWVRSGTAVALARSWPEAPEVVTTLLQILQDANEDQTVRRYVASSLAYYLSHVPDIKAILMQVLQDASEDAILRGETAWGLSQDWTDDSELHMILMQILKDPNENQTVRTRILYGLGQTDDEVCFNILLNLFHDKNQTTSLRAAVVHALDQASSGRPEVLPALRQAVHEPELRAQALSSLWTLLSRNGTPEQLGLADSC